MRLWAMSDLDHLTILTGTAYLAKRVDFDADGALLSSSPSICRDFSVEERGLNGLADLHETLQSLQSHSHSAVIRGKLIEGRPTKQVRRTSRHRDLEPPNFEAVARNWVMIDIDDLALPPVWSDINANVDAILAYTVSHLPEAFSSAKCVYQWSGSMGVKRDKIRVHLWYWLDRAVSNRELKAWLAGCPFDPLLFSAVQLHFTANPIFEQGAIDPLQQRMGLYEPKDAVDTVSVPEMSDIPAFVPSRIRGVSSNGLIDGQGIIRDKKTGLVIDGRERFLLLCSNQAMQSLLADSSGTPSLDDITQQTWDLFSTEADLSDGKWSEHSAREEAQRRYEEHQSGTYSFTSRNEMTTLLPVSDPFETPEYVTVQEGQDRLQEALSRFFDRLEMQPKLALRITMGAGKTRKTLEHLQTYLNENRVKIVEIYAPRHDLAEQYLHDIQDIGGVRAKVIHVKPRTDTSDGLIEGQCKRKEFVKSLNDAGLGVYRNACHSDDGETCTYFSDCPYLQQFDQRGAWDEGVDAGNVVHILVHDYLRLPRNPLQPDPDLVIIDEAFWQKMVSTDRSLSRHDIRTHLTTKRFPKLGRWIVEALECGYPLLESLRDEGVDADALSEIDLSALKPEVAFSADSNTAKRPSGNPSLYHSLSLVIRILREELDLGREQVERLVFDEENDTIRIADASYTDIPETAAVLMLDATSEETVLSRFFDDVHQARIDVEQKAVVTQVYDRTGSKVHWEGGTAEIEKLVDVVNTWAEFGEKPLIISFKSVNQRIAETERLNPKVKLNHFGALRGSNEAEECSVAFIVGRMLPKAVDVDLQARALFWDEEDPLEHDDTAKYLPLSQRGYLQSERNPKPQSGVMVPTFRDQRVDTLLRQIQDAETMQALGRLRMVHSNQMKRVFLLSNLPVSIPVDHLVEFNELMPDRLEYELIKKGQVPLTPKGLNKMRPDITNDENSARAIIRRSKLPNASTVRSFPSLGNASIFEATFRAGDQRLTEHRHLFLVRGKQDQGLVVGPVPNLNDIETFLEQGDPEIKGSGWGKVQDLRVDFWGAGLQVPIP